MIVNARLGNGIVRRNLLRTGAAVCVLPVLLLASQMAAAQVSDKLKAACGADYKAHCSTVVPGGGRIIACMKAHAAQLSPGCKAALAEAGPASAPKGQAQTR